MSDILEQMGNKIRVYRKQMGLSLSQFSKLIHKSEPTISKYENGKISIDFLTLFDIANALHIHVHDLIDVSLGDFSVSTKHSSNNPFLDHQLLYLYYYDGRVKAVTKSVIKYFKSEENGYEATFFVDVQSFEKFEKCKYIYTGTADFFDMVTHFNFRNNVSPLERVNISIVSPMEQFSCTTGLMNAIAYDSFNPLTIKVAISKKIIPNLKDIDELLMLTKDELKNIRKNNMMSINKISK